MFPQAMVDFFADNQELLWFTTLFVDLGCTLVLYRLFGKAGLQVAIAVAIILANLQGPETDRHFRPANQSRRDLLLEHLLRDGCS